MIVAFIFQSGAPPEPAGHAAGAAAKSTRPQAKARVLIWTLLEKCDKRRRREPRGARWPVLLPRRRVAREVGVVLGTSFPGVRRRPHPGAGLRTPEGSDTLVKCGSRGQVVLDPSFPNRP